MILIILSALLLILSLVFFISTLIMSANLKRLKNSRNWKLLKKRRRNSVLLALLCLAVGVTLLVAYILPRQRARSMKNGGYDLKSTYASVLASGGDQKAYNYLPVEIQRFGDTFAVRNGRNEWFSFDTIETAPEQTEQKWTYRYGRTLRAAQSTLSGDTALDAHLGEDGRLYLEGQFPFMKYDSHTRTYGGVVASGVSDFYCSGNSIYYITNKGALYAFGFNEYGQLGDTSNRHKVSPVFIRDNMVFATGSATHAMFIDSFGNLYAAGDNGDSELGDGTMNNSSTPIKVMSGVGGAACGNYFTVAMAQNGDVYTCGRTDHGQCGNGTPNGTAKFVKIGENARKVAAAKDTALYMTEDGKVFGWGKNTDHCLVTDDTEFLNAPTLIAENAYDVAIRDGCVAILGRDRTVRLSGNGRKDKKALFETRLDLAASVPEEYVSPFAEDEKKPDISSLGK